MEARSAYYASRREHARRQNAGYRAYALLRFAVKVARFPVGAALEERELMHAFRFSRASIREALNRLSTDGLVVRKPAIGTILITEPIELRLEDLRPMNPRHEMTFLHTEKVVIPESQYLSSRLGGSSAENVVMTETIVMINDEPVAVNTAFSRSGGRAGTSLPGRSEVLRPRAEDFSLEYGVEFSHAEISLDACLADTAIAALLNTEPGSPLIVREEILYGMDGNIWQYGYSQIRTDAIVLRSGRA